MWVNFILPNLNPSGGVKVVLAYAKWLNEHGHDCVVYYPLVEKAKHMYKDVPYTVPYFFKNRIRPAHITLATSWETAKTVLDLPDKCGVKAYFIQHYEKIWDPRADDTYDYPLKQIVVSMWLKNTLNLLYGTNPTVVENGVVLPDLDTVRKDGEPPFILMPWRQESWKGTEYGIQALNKVHEKHPECEFHVFGWNIIKELVPEYIDVHSNITDDAVYSLMRQADIFVNPTTTEGFGLPSLEAMARSCAVVTTKVGAVPEYTDCGLSAVVVDPYDVEQMTNAINNLIECKEIRWAYQLLAYNTSRRWSFDTAARRFEECLISLVQ